MKDNVFKQAACQSKKAICFQWFAARQLEQGRFVLPQHAVFVKNADTKCV